MLNHRLPLKVLPPAPRHPWNKLLPALTRATKVLKKADKLYDRHTNKEEALQKIEEAVQKLRAVPEEAYSKDAEAQVDFINVTSTMSPSLIWSRESASPNLSVKEVIPS